jgi:disulfide oxidoreductase YuzD
MEPVSVITGAIVTGAAAAAKGVGKQVVKDAYEGLKALVKRRFSEKEKPEGEMALVKIEEKPEVWEAPLKETLVETGADKDEEIIRAAEKLVTALKSTPEGREVIGKYNLNIKDSQVGVIGDRAEIKDGIHFGK